MIMNSSTSKSSNAIHSSMENRYIPELENLEPVEEGRLDQYMKELHDYYIHGIKTKESLSREVLPIQLAAHLAEDRSHFDYPAYFDENQGAILPLYDTVDHLIAQHFEEALVDDFRAVLPEVFSNIQNSLQEESQGLDTKKWIEELGESFQFLDTPGIKEEGFSLKIQAFQDDLSKQIGTLFGCAAKSVFQLLDLQNSLGNTEKVSFVKDLKKVSTGLNELLLLEGNAPDLTIGQLDFADDLISFDKIRDVALDTVSSHLPESLLNRVKWALRVLLNAQEAYTKTPLTIVTSSAINQEFNLERLFSNAKIEAVSENSCHRAKVQAKQNTKEFVEVIAALRMGKLLIQQKYDEQLHDVYFDQFDLDHLSEDDLRNFPPIVLIEEAGKLMRQSNDLLALLTNESFVKVLGINTLKDLYEINNPEEPSYLELASLAIFRRSSYVFQAGIDDPVQLKESFQKGLNFPGSVLWNILVPGQQEKAEGTQYLELLAAIESRYFPRIEYVADDNHFAFQQIKLRKNPSPEATFATFEQEIKSVSGIESKVFNLTIANFLATRNLHRAKLEVVPSDYQSTNLMPLAEYLALSQDMVLGKIPFIWMVDDQDSLKQVAVPFKWVQISRSRLEYWDFLQSIAGINKDHLQATIKELKLEWDEEKNAEIEKLKLSLNAQFEQEKSGILEQGVTQMLFGLLEGDNIESVLTGISQSGSQANIENNLDQKASTGITESQKEEVEIPQPVIEEAWVESEDCTSCKDCVVAVPSVFKYNEDKQAYVYNSKGASFAQIVAAAEKCPARCIHPGVPQDKNEPALDKWVKRAEKYN